MWMTASMSCPVEHQHSYAELRIESLPWRCFFQSTLIKFPIVTMSSWSPALGNADLRVDTLGALDVLGWGRDKSQTQNERSSAEPLTHEPYTQHGAVRLGLYVRCNQYHLLAIEVIVVFESPVGYISDPHQNKIQAFICRSHVR